MAREHGTMPKDLQHKRVGRAGNGGDHVSTLGCAKASTHHQPLMLREVLLEVWVGCEIGGLNVFVGKTGVLNTLPGWRDFIEYDIQVLGIKSPSEPIELHLLTLEPMH